MTLTSNISHVCQKSVCVLLCEGAWSTDPLNTRTTKQPCVSAKLQNFNGDNNAFDDTQIIPPSLDQSQQNHAFRTPLLCFFCSGLRSSMGALFTPLTPPLLTTLAHIWSKVAALFKRSYEDKCVLFQRMRTVDGVQRTKTLLQSSETVVGCMNGVSVEPADAAHIPIVSHRFCLWVVFSLFLR